ncbi:hypothetical protein MN116_001225 [Schistosoma mekongi]|uniref:C2H2-type domain-containing protein n=1 Tax=Schistosoma mekongi TaxID=38744 RepID=A0AAE2DA88_SCHME|nr:hypothetical protein MN116_001225 [Schistosoma mekongi]
MIHLNSHGAEDQLSRLICQRCSKSFKSHLTLKHHIEVCSNSNSEPKFCCEICKKKFRTDIQYTRHIYYTHSQRTFLCKEKNCGRTFLSNSHLIAHMITHTSDRPYPCPVLGCSYKARTAGRLAQHKIIHGQGRRFSCDYCEYSATTSSNLRRHARIHAGARPYLCPHCPHRTSELDALKKHVLDSGRHPGLPLYVCPWCRSESSTVCVGFNASGLAWRHLLSEHSSEIMKPETLGRIGRLSEESLSERDVTRLLGIYCPEIDLTQPPENTVVRQPSVANRHRNQKIGTLGNILHSCEENGVMIIEAKQSISSGNINSVEEVETDLHFVHDDFSLHNLIQIGSGAIWSRNTPQHIVHNL